MCVRETEREREREFLNALVSMSERERERDAEKETKENTEIMGKRLMQEREFVDLQHCITL